MRIFHCLSVAGIALVHSSRDVVKRRASGELSETTPLADSVNMTIEETDMGGAKRSRVVRFENQDVLEAADLLLSMGNWNSGFVDPRASEFINASPGLFNMPENTQASEVSLHAPQAVFLTVPTRQTSRGTGVAAFADDPLTGPHIADPMRLTIWNKLARELAAKNSRVKNVIPSYECRREPTRAVAYVYPPTEAHNTGNRLEYSIYMKRRVDVRFTIFQRAIKCGCMDWSANTLATQKMLMYMGVLESFHNALLIGTPNVEEYLVLQNLGHRIDDLEFARSIVFEWNRYCIEPLRLWEAGDRRAVPPCGPTENTISGERLFRLSKWQFQEFSRRLMEITSLYIERSDELKRGGPGSVGTYLDIHDRRLVEVLMDLPTGTLPYRTSHDADGSIL